MSKSHPGLKGNQTTKKPPSRVAFLFPVIRGMETLTMDQKITHRLSALKIATHFESDIEKALQMTNHILAFAGGGMSILDQEKTKIKSPQLFKVLNC
jgi:hypothetical protein